MKIRFDFESRLDSWLLDLSRPHQISPRIKKYWTIPSYAAAHGIHPKTACKWFRELEKVAKRLYPHHVPYHRRAAPALTAEKIQAIRDDYAKTGDAKAVAAKYDIAAFRVGQLCRKEKAAREAERETAYEQAENTAFAGK